jgi:hypothetical protein
MKKITSKFLLITDDEIGHSEQVVEFTELSPPLRALFWYDREEQTADATVRSENATYYVLRLPGDHPVPLGDVLGHPLNPGKWVPK